MFEGRFLEIPHRIMRIVYRCGNAGTKFMFGGDGVAKQCIATPEPVFERFTPRGKLSLKGGQFLFLRRVQVELAMDQRVEFCPPMMRCRLKHTSEPHPDQRKRNDQPRCQGYAPKIHS